MEETLIWGAGAIGGTIGAYLTRAGHAVRFVDVAVDHLRAIQAKGLRISGPADDFTIRAPAVTPEQLSGQFNRILLAVKAHHTAAAAAMLAPHLTEHGYVVSCQNGLNELVIAEVVGKTLAPTGRHRDISRSEIVARWCWANLMAKQRRA